MTSDAPASHQSSVSPFPRCLPPDLDDAAIIADHDWSAFLHLHQMQDHWDRPGWDPGSRAYYWMLTFPDGCDLARSAKRNQQALAALGMDPVPEDGLHITLARVGDIDVVTRVKVADLTSRVDESLRGAFSLTVGPLTGSQSAIRWSVAPWTPLLQLHRALTIANQQVCVPGGLPTSKFRPHLGIAYNNRIRPVRSVVEMIDPLRSDPVLNVDIESVDLVELRREGFAYRWDVIFRISL